MNDKEKIAMLKLAIEQLNEVDAESIETIELSHSTYDDGSKGFSINLTYPSEPKQTITYYADGEEVKILNK